MPQNHPLVAEATNLREIPQKYPITERDYSVDYDEDLTRRWVAMATFGMMVFATGFLPIFTAARTGNPVNGSDLVAPLIAIGLLELILGAMASAVWYPAAFVWVILASILTVAQGIVMSVGGVEATWVAAAAFLTTGLVCAGVGIWRGTVSWKSFRRDAP